MRSARITPPAHSILGAEISAHALRFLAVAAGLFATAVFLAHYSTVAFVGVGALLLLSLGYACWHWPQPTLIVLAIIPLFDRYLVSLVIPDDLHLVARLFSEGLLLIAAVVISTRAIRDGRFLPAIRQPILVPLLAFLVIAAASVVVNAVPAVNAIFGIGFTVDAIVLFFLAAMVPWRLAHLRAFALVLVGIAGAAAIVAIAQVVLSPSILGLSASAGRFGEGARVGSFFGGNPNILGAMLAISAPFCFFAATNLADRRARALALGLGFVLVLALLFTFSRGAWFGLAGAVLVTGLLFDRRILAVAGLTAALAFATANVLPRHLLETGAAGQAPETDFIGSTFERINTIGEGRDLRVRFIDQGLPLLAETPLVGVGPGQYGGAVAQTWGSSVHEQLGARAPERTVDNFWLHLLVEFGILGTIAYVAVYVAAAVHPLRRAWGMRGPVLVLLAGAMAATGALALDSVTEMILEGNTFSLPAWLLLGVAAAWSARPEADGGDEPGVPAAS